MEEMALRPSKIVVAAGIYTDVVEVVAPSTAMAGSRVDVTVRVKNIDPTYYHWVACVAIYDGSAHFIDQDAFLAPKETYPFSGHFTMPNKDITITAYSYYSYYGEWIPDDEMSKDVKLAAYPSADIKDLAVVITGGLPPEAELFRKLEVTYKKI